jgi:hypothetical protein
MSGLMKQPQSLAEIVKARNINLNPKQAAVIAAGSKPKIRDLDAAETKDSILRIIRYVKKDIGLVGELSGYEQARALDFITKYYADLTVPDIKTAFELLLIGELDKHLPKDKHGNADRNHYQELSAAYITKVLNAYRLHKGEVTYEVRGYLPAPEVKISQEQRAENLKALQDTIIECWRIIKKGDSPDPLSLNFVVCDYLESKGFVKEVKEVTETARSMAYADIAKNGNPWDIKEARRGLSGEIQSAVLEFNAKRRQRLLEVLEWFKSVKSEKELIKLIK